MFVCLFLRGGLNLYPTFQEEEEVGNLQLAWEMLEVAKVIYKRLVHFKIKLMVQEAQL